MLHNEFEKLIGREASETEYVIANAAYMRDLNSTKEEFCKEYKHLCRSGVFQDILKDYEKTLIERNALKKYA